MTATAIDNAWSVGTTGTGETLILHWDGTSWERQPSPTAATTGQLASVTATAIDNAWSVGTTGTGKALILHWNGATWQRQPTPAPPKVSNLTAVAATSARSAWAVGTFGNGLGSIEDRPALGRHEVATGAASATPRQCAARGRCRPGWRGVGGGLPRLRGRPEQDADPALERHRVEGGTQP